MPVSWRRWTGAATLAILPCCTAATLAERVIGVRGAILPRQDRP